MKSLAASLALFLAAATVHAGGFGGPPPFTNGSPLPDGVDGSYQASATAPNTTGIIRFKYMNGVQTTNFAENMYVIFVEGLIYNGDNDVAINDGKITGIIDVGNSLVPSMLGATLSGYFTAKADKNSPIYYFKGKGEIVGTISVPVSLQDPLGIQTPLRKSIKIKGSRIAQN